MNRNTRPTLGLRKTLMERWRAEREARAALAAEQAHTAHAKPFDTSPEPVKNGGDSLHVTPTDDEQEADALCGDWPAPSNCDDPDTHDGSVPRAVVESERRTVQGEPTDAQVRAASESLAHSAGYIPEPVVRAALRAAGGAR